MSSSVICTKCGAMSVDQCRCLYVGNEWFKPANPTDFIVDQSISQQLTEAQAEVERLSNLVEQLIPELKQSIEITWNGCYGAQHCVYCGESLGNKLAKAKEHRKTCEKIPANIARKVLSNESYHVGIKNKLCADAVRKFAYDLSVGLTTGDGIGFENLGEVEFDGFAKEYASQLERGE